MLRGLDFLLDYFIGNTTEGSISYKRWFTFTVCFGFSQVRWGLGDRVVWPTRDDDARGTERRRRLLQV